jgi:hypothetical protein
MGAKNREKWRGLSADVRQQYMTNDFSVLHPEFVRVAYEIKRRMKRCMNEKAGAGMIVLAPSGTGKTHLCKFLKARWPNEHTETLTIVPVVWFTVPSRPTERSMSQALLQAMGCPLWNTGTTHVLTHRILTLIPTIGTRVILIDNVHDIPDRRSDSGIRHVGNWIRTLIDECQTLVVLLGTPSALEIVRANSQLRRRATKQLQMDYFYIDTSGNFERFKKFLKMLFDGLPLANESELSDDLVREIHDATFGIFDYIIQLHVEAVGCAVRKGRERLIREDFATAFMLIHNDAAAHSPNPFTAGPSRRALTEPGELFSKWFDVSNPSLRAPREKKKNEV